jgi:hypothetical protein
MSGCDLFWGQFESPADNQRDCNGASIHNQDVLQSKRNEFSERQALVDRMNGFCHDSPLFMRAP